MTNQKSKKDLKDEIMHIRKLHRNKLSELRTEQSKLIYTLCTDNGGHFWLPEQREFYQMCVPEYNHYRWTKQCEICGAVKSRPDDENGDEGNDESKI